MSPALIPAIDADGAFAAGADFVLLDVCEHDEWIRGHAPTAIHIPMSELMTRLDELDRTKHIICTCRSGSRSRPVTEWLLQQGIDARNMTGGMASWANFGHPLVNRAGNPGVVI